jgi:hypothetical protein
MDCLGNQGLSRLGKIVQSGREVNRLAGDCVFLVEAASGATGQHLAAGDADMDFEGPSNRFTKADNVAMDPDRRMQGAFDVVVMRNRGAKDGHYCVADVLVDPTSGSFDDAIDSLEEAAQKLMNLLRIEFTAQAGKGAKVGEKNRDLATVACGHRRSIGFGGWF